MGSGYFGEPNLGNNERGGSSRKGKKNNSDKPKQPQRGLGVAQLEKIRLHGQMVPNYHPSLHSTPYPTTFNQQEDIRMQTGYSSVPSSSFSYSSSSAASSSASYGYPNIMMGLGDYDRTNVRSYGDSQPSTAARLARFLINQFNMFNFLTSVGTAGIASMRLKIKSSWNSGHSIYEAQNYGQPNATTRHLLPLQVEETPQKHNKKHRSSSMGSSSQNSESSDTQELDLELRLSI
ncbi:unnamed protein product [Dovyalis caffra]|uniref:Uncharacterized protein n=1 Tax=Dovyalis caffra TaxID=77055 RepID=A0AAV1RP17_9ROSI|nr:unnamed protein product [Dovyalis caffra]